VLQHRNVSDATLAKLARTVTGEPQEALVVNQARLLRNPELIDALYENPDLTADSRRMLNELKEEFFEKATRRQTAHAKRRERSREIELPAAEEVSGTLEGDDDAGEEDEPQGDSAVAATADAAADPSRLGAEDLYLRLMSLTVPERV